MNWHNSYKTGSLNCHPDGTQRSKHNEVLRHSPLNIKWRPKNQSKLQLCSSNFKARNTPLRHFYCTALLGNNSPRSEMVSCDVSSSSVEIWSSKDTFRTKTQSARLKIINNSNKFHICAWHSVWSPLLKGSFMCCVTVLDFYWRHISACS